METVSTEFMFFFYQERPGAQLGGTRRDSQPRSPSAENPDIIVVIGHTASREKFDYSEYNRGARPNQQTGEEQILRVNPERCRMESYSNKRLW